MFDCAGLLFVSTLAANLTVATPVDLKQPGDAGKEKTPPPEMRPDKEDFQEMTPVVTEHTVTLPGDRTLSYRAIAGYLLIRET